MGNTEAIKLSWFSAPIKDKGSCLIAKLLTTAFKCYLLTDHVLK